VTDRQQMSRYSHRRPLLLSGAKIASFFDIAKKIHRRRYSSRRRALKGHPDPTCRQAHKTASSLLNSAISEA
jgi:hypothetical protein